MTYKIVLGQNADELEKKVNNYINAGFVLVGGVSVGISGETEFTVGTLVFCQAMTYKKDSE